MDIKHGILTVLLAAAGGVLAAESALPGVAPGENPPAALPSSGRSCPPADASTANRTLIEAALERSEQRKKPTEEEEEEEERRLDCCF